MSSNKHFRPSDLRSLARLAVDATLGVTGVVENVHHNIARGSAPLGPASQAPTTGITGLVYRAIRGTTRLTGAALDLALRPVETALGKLAPPATGDSPEREALVAALNGVVGDHLQETGSSLAIPMTLQHGGVPLVLEREWLSQHLPQASGRVLLLIHGLCMGPQQWRRDGHDLGARLAGSGGDTVLHLHYNTGRHVGTNGREFAGLMQQLVAQWPVDLQQVTILAHSMGGLVARSACHQALARGDTWPQRLRSIVFLGTPHHGAPLERAGHIVDVVLGASPYTAGISRIGAVRSAGINDLRHGNLLEGEDGIAAPAHVPLPEGIACYAIAGEIGDKQARLKPRLLGDGLVTVDSALGRHKDTARCLHFAEDRQWTAHGVGHIDLLHDSGVQDRIASWLAAR